MPRFAFAKHSGPMNFGGRSPIRSSKLTLSSSTVNTTSNVMPTTMSPTSITTHETSGDQSVLHQILNNTSVTKASITTLEDKITSLSEEQLDTRSMLYQ